MAGTETWAGWIRFGGVLMMIIAFLDFFQGLIAILRDQYYVLTPHQIVVFDLTTWGWIMLIWSFVLGVSGAALMSGMSWGRWVGIIAGSINFVVQLGFAGGAQYPLWSLAVLALNAIILYALIVRWEDAGELLRQRAETRL